MLDLRSYQVEGAEQIRNAYRNGARAVLYVAPPGSGKTVLFASVCRGAARRGNSVHIVAHRAELLDQISAALNDQDVDHGFVAGGYQYRRGKQVYVCSALTLAKRLDEIPTPQLTIVDEAHHVAGNNSWARILDCARMGRVLGVTASPARLDGQGLEAHFDEMVVGPSYAELQALGYLTKVRVFAPPTISTDGLHTRFGEYHHGEIEERATRPAVTGSAIEHYQRLTPGRRAIVFDVSVEAARGRAEEFRAAGYEAACIDGTLSRDVRARIVADFRSGRVTVLTSCDIVSEGFDLPAIEVAISLRPTKSLALYLQQTGRALRPYPGKPVAYLFDHAGNCTRFGLPDETRSWALSGLPARSKHAQPVASARVCPTCFAASPAGSVVCTECGAEFPRKPREVHQKEGKLEELTVEQLILRRKRQEQGTARTLAALIDLGRKRGMRRPELWANHVMMARQRKRSATP